MSVRDAVLVEARDWLGTPYRHQSSLKGVGTDCLGLVRGVWRQVIGEEPELPAAYTPDWAEKTGEDRLLKAFRTHFVEKPISAAEPGDVFLFRMGLGCPAKHAAIVSGPDRIIHAYWGRSVCETRLVPWWERRIAGCFEFPFFECARSSSSPADRSTCGQPGRAVRCSTQVTAQAQKA